MKIEKLTDNKIRVIIHSDELECKNVNLHSIMTKAIETQEIFSDILVKAEKEYDFCTDGCKLLIEAFSSSEDIIVFTITKFSLENTIRKKKLVAKRKSFNKVNQQAVCRFEDFDTFCSFCNAMRNVHKVDYHKLAKHTILYLWQDSYYLVFKNINTEDKNISLLYSILSEFGKILSFSDSFESKLSEHGKAIIKKNALDVGIQYF